MAQKKKSAKKAPKKGISKAKNNKRPLESLSQTHGKEEKKVQATTLDQLWGDTGHTKYGTIDVNDYIRQLDDMNKSDLQSHARFIGFVPIDDRVTLTNKLVSEFKKYVSGFNKPTHVQNDPRAPISAKTRKILSEGR
jgi:hypothetical protein